MKRTILGSLVVMAIAILVASSFGAAMNLQATNASVGSGAKYIAVAYGNGTFVEVWYSYDGKYMNATVINSTTGTVLKTGTISTDIYTYNGAPSIKPAIAHIPDTDTFLIAWVNSTNYLKAIGVNSNLDITYNETTINDTSGVSYKGIALAVGGGRAFFVWSDSSYHLEGRFINDTYTGPVFRISSFDSEQKSPWIAYDPMSDNFMVVWINHTAYYNVTGKIFDASNMTPITGDITIGDAYADQSSYTAPAVSGGAGMFFVTYVTYTSPYNITGKIYDAATGNLNVGPFLIGATYYYGRSPMPAVFDGNNFVVAWSNATESILATTYSPNATALNTQIIYGGTNGGNPIIAYDDANRIYFFSWAEYQGSGNPYGISASLWTYDEFVPEFGMMVPVLAVAALGFLVFRRMH